MPPSWKFAWNTPTPPFYSPRAKKQELRPKVGRRHDPRPRYRLSSQVAIHTHTERTGFTTSREPASVPSSWLYFPKSHLTSNPARPPSRHARLRPSTVPSYQLSLGYFYHAPKIFGRNGMHEPFTNLFSTCTLWNASQRGPSQANGEVPSRCLCTIVIRDCCDIFYSNHVLLLAC